MRKQILVAEWYIAKDDADWERLCAPPNLDSPLEATPTIHTHRYPRRLLAGIVAILLLASTIGWWHSAQPKLHQDESELSATAEPKLRAIAFNDNPLAVRVTDDQATLYWELHFAREHNGLRAVGQIALSEAQLDIALPTFAVHGDQAVARVVMYTEHGAPAYRQTRFYQRIGSNWRQTAPDAALWGPVRSLATPYFVYHFRQNDAPAVLAVAPQMDALYRIMRRNFGLPIMPTPDKLAIEVSVTQPSGQAVPRLHGSDRFTVPSPAVYLAPVELTDADLLAQSIALPLLNYLLGQASEHHAIGSTWQPLLSGLYLWQMWDLDLPLAVWREEVVTWIYHDLPASRPGQAVVLPEHYTALCAAHKLWMPSPTQIEIPLVCSVLDWEDLFLSPWGSYDPLIRLDQLVVPLRPGGYIEESDSVQRVRHPGHTVALATLIKYAVAIYGRESLPALVAGLGQYESWDTLLPAVFGVSAAEFEAGWQSYLMARYGFTISRVSPEGRAEAGW